MAQVNIHPSLVRFTNHQHQLELSIDKAAAVVSVLCEHFPLLKSSILSVEGVLTPYVNIYINGKNLNQCIPHLSLTPDDQIDVVTALVGG
ncbi:MAG: MoaD/ThiS family protein [Gammaproteobacteria bacterium]|nr:MoaD/ThiS family protein [Gammaproteobacteria bacterium]